MVRALGIEPRTQAWKARVLPLNYARILKGLNMQRILSERSIFHLKDKSLSLIILKYAKKTRKWKQAQEDDG